MFKNNAEDEADFCEAYKSQILNHDTEEKESPISSILIILFLLAMIIALSIFGYNYITKSNNISENTPVSVQAIADDELKVTEEEALPVSVKKEPSIKKELDAEEIKKVVIKSFDELPKSKSVDINDLADKIKIDMSQNEEKNDSLKESSSKEENKKTEESLPSVTDSVKNTYIEDLAKLTEEIDKERE